MVGIHLDTGVSTHSRPKAAAGRAYLVGERGPVSTHSRPKAAADQNKWYPVTFDSFNTQPPEGGCLQIVLP